MTDGFNALDGVTCTFTEVGLAACSNSVALQCCLPKLSSGTSSGGTSAGGGRGSGSGTGGSRSRVGWGTKTAATRLQHG